MQNMTIEILSGNRDGTLDDNSFPFIVKTCDDSLKVSECILGANLSECNQSIQFMIFIQQPFASDEISVASNYPLAATTADTNIFYSINNSNNQFTSTTLNGPLISSSQNSNPNSSQLLFNCLWSHPTPCFRQFNSGKELFEHVTGGPHDPNKLYCHVGTKRSTENKYNPQCYWPNCGVNKPKRDHLINHILTHIDFSNDPLYKCQICHKPFTRPQDLKRHQKTHENSASSSSSSTKPQSISNPQPNSTLNGKIQKPKVSSNSLKFINYQHADNKSRTKPSNTNINDSSQQLVPISPPNTDGYASPNLLSNLQSAFTSLQVSQFDNPELLPDKFLDTDYASLLLNSQTIPALGTVSLTETDLQQMQGVPDSIYLDDTYGTFGNINSNVLTQPLQYGNFEQGANFANYGDDSLKTIPSPYVSLNDQSSPFQPTDSSFLSELLLNVPDATNSRNSSQYSLLEPNPEFNEAVIYPPDLFLGFNIADVNVTDDTLRHISSEPDMSRSTSDSSTLKKMLSDLGIGVETQQKTRTARVPPPKDKSKELKEDGSKKETEERISSIVPDETTAVVSDEVVPYETAPKVVQRTKGVDRSNSDLKNNLNRHSIASNATFGEVSPNGIKAFGYKSVKREPSAASEINGDVKVPSQSPCLTFGALTPQLVSKGIEKDEDSIDAITSKTQELSLDSQKTARTEVQKELQRTRSRSSPPPRRTPTPSPIPVTPQSQKQSPPSIALPKSDKRKYPARTLSLTNLNTSPLFSTLSKPRFQTPSPIDVTTRHPYDSNPPSATSHFKYPDFPKSVNDSEVTVTRSSIHSGWYPAMHDSLSRTNDVNVVVLGDENVGKSSLVEKFAEDMALEYEKSSNLVVRLLKKSKRPSKNEKESVNLCVRDVLAEGGGINVNWNEMDYIILVFSIVDPRSLKSVTSNWLNLIPRESRAKIILVGCKSDLKHDWKEWRKLSISHQTPVTRLEGRKVAMDIGAIKYFEFSTKREAQVGKIFGFIASDYSKKDSGEGLSRTKDRASSTGLVSKVKTVFRRMSLLNLRKSFER
ncbi:Rho- GTP-binding protein RhoE [Nowakowskiella sp. JEL0407]|nr:Rho- GTP-binding protein RhoE [Nowakowskiella sp. JEL0407]